MRPCVYRDLSDESYRQVVGSDKWEPCETWLCSWPCVHLPATAPTWVRKQIGGGTSIVPERDCANCPACPDDGMVVMADDWQPISTAPRDREIILWRSAWTGPTQGRWIEPGDDWMGSTRGLRAGWYMAGYAGALGPVEPTHWQPLPDPPAAGLKS